MTLQSIVIQMKGGSTLFKKHIVKGRHKKKHCTVPKYKVDVHVSANSETRSNNTYPYYHKKKR